MTRNILEIFGPIAVKVLAGVAGATIFAPLLAAFLAPIVG